ncbi:sigma-70 family RNA polymerase sigma factor, partial [Nitriliruptoraceae bacterium ZYF776]|nr:sigma-70 family RNA polymerase sigma factor [Profundirhabdus halotolerans]
EREREILLLVYWEHLSVKAVAAVLDCRPGTAAVRLHRARRSLREALSEPTAAPIPPHVSEATS